MNNVFTTYNQVRMHDTDTVGILFFGSQFRYAHDALEDFCVHIGLPIPRLVAEGSFVFVVRHAEADYLAPLGLGDRLAVKVDVTNIGTSAFTLSYAIWREDVLVGTAQTVHVTVDSKTRVKIPIPTILKEALLPYCKNA